MTRKLHEYKTYDLGCAAALVSAGFDLDALDKSNARKVLFIFRQEAGVEKTVNDYWSDKLQVNARALVDNLKMLKNRIYSE